MKKKKQLWFWIVAYPCLKIISNLVAFGLPWIEKLAYIRFGYARTDRIGELIPQMAIYLAKPPKKSLDFWCFKKPYCNEVVVKKIKEVREINDWKLGEALFDNIYKILYKKASLKRFCIEIPSRDVEQTVKETPTFLRLSEKEESIGNNFLKKENLKPGASFVCLHVRDKKYLKNKENKQAEQTNTLRNSKIKGYRKSITWLCKKKIHVFRMGKNQEKRLFIKNKYFHDYAFCKERSDLLDVFLGTKCKFVISTSSGWDAIPVYSFKPVLITNLFPVYDFLSFYRDAIVIFKKYYWQTKNRYFKIDELANLKLFNVTDKKILDENNIRIHENTDLEILAALKERFYLRNKKTRINMKLQERFRKKIKALNSLAGFVNHDKITAYVGFSFLKTNSRFFT